MMISPPNTMGRSECASQLDMACPNQDVTLKDLDFDARSIRGTWELYSN